MIDQVKDKPMVTNEMHVEVAVRAVLPDVRRRGPGCWQVPLPASWQSLFPPSSLRRAQVPASAFAAGSDPSTVSRTCSEPGFEGSDPSTPSPTVEGSDPLTMATASLDQQRRWLRLILGPVTVNSWADLHHALQRNGSLPAGWRLVLPVRRKRGEFVLMARADLLVAPASTLARRLGAAIPARPARGAAGDADAPAGGATGSILELLEAAGWVATQRRGGAVSVPLPAGDGIFRARLQPDGSEASVHLGRWDLPAVCADALAALLLAGTGACRLVRPVVAREGDTWSASLQVPLDRPATVEGVDAALGALTVACRLMGREAPALATSPPLAQAYLQLQGWPQ